MCCSYPSRSGFRFFGRSRKRDRSRHLSPADTSWPRPGFATRRCRLLFVGYLARPPALAGCVYEFRCRAYALLDDERTRASVSLPPCGSRHGRPAVRHHGLGASCHRRGCSVSGMGMVGTWLHDSRPCGSRNPHLASCRHRLRRPLAVVRRNLDRPETTGRLAQRRS